MEWPQRGTSFLFSGHLVQAAHVVIYSPFVVNWKSHLDSCSGRRKRFVHEIPCGVTVRCSEDPLVTAEFPHTKIVGVESGVREVLPDLLNPRAKHGDRCLRMSRTLPVRIIRATGAA